MTQPADVPLLQMKGICKSFPGIQALNGVDLEVHSGEAGKRTLIMVLSGAHLLDAGSIRIEGEVQTIADPVDAQRARVAVIYQEFNLIAALSARENIFLGQEKAAARNFRATGRSRSVSSAVYTTSIPPSTELLGDAVVRDGAADHAGPILPLRRLVLRTTDPLSYGDGLCVRRHPKGKNHVWSYDFLRNANGERQAPAAADAKC